MIILRGKVSIKDLSGSEKILRKLSERHVQKAINFSIKPVRDRIKILLSNALENSEEWKSILDGQLRQEFGLSEPQLVLETIKETLVNSISVSSFIIPKALGAMKVEILPEDVERKLADGLSYMSKGGEVNWLNWLLFSGTQLILADVRFRMFDKFVKASRAGYSLMIRAEPLGYSVSPEFAGNSNSNWFDKILAPLGKSLIQVMIEEVQRRL